MDDDIDLSLSPREVKPHPRQGRRANNVAFADSGPSKNPAAEPLFGSPLKSRPLSGDLFLDEGSRAPPTAPPKGRRMGGWSEERAKTAKSVRIQSAAQHIGGGIGDRFSDDEDDSIPVIPDLDDVQDEDMALTVAEAPSVAVNRVATYRELDNDLLKHVAFATLDDIDLRLLTKCLVPEAQLKEPDEVWTWDEVFAKVSGDLQKEWFPEEEAEEKAEAAKERPYTAFNRFPV